MRRMEGTRGSPRFSLFPIPEGCQTSRGYLRHIDYVHEFRDGRCSCRSEDFKLVPGSPSARAEPVNEEKFGPRFQR
jgi:hypothetical protein